MVILPYEQRHRRRGLMHTDGGEEILLDLPEPTELRDDDALVPEDGRHILVRAAREPLAEVRAEDPRHLARLAWHVGNRHTPGAGRGRPAADPARSCDRGHAGPARPASPMSRRPSRPRAAPTATAARMPTRTATTRSTTRTRICGTAMDEALAKLAALLPLARAVAGEAVTAPLDAVGGCGLRADIASMRHETQYTRLFRS